MSSAVFQDERFVRIAGDSMEHEERLNDFTKVFLSITKSRPDYIVRSPGRVNLIGDHIDYHGFPVLPMAIEKSIWLGVSFGKVSDEHDSMTSPAGAKSSLVLYNRDQEGYPTWTNEHSFNYGDQLNKSHKWHHYILCGYHGILATQLLNIEPKNVLNHAHNLASSNQLSARANALLDELESMRILVDGDLPPASGLSSSSALVCASAIATSLLLHHQKDQHDLKTVEAADTTLSQSKLGKDNLGTPVALDKRLLAESCSKFEHLIGTHGGGMDQAVIMTAQKNFAKYVEFVPKLKYDNVQLPDHTVWLVSHCGSSYPKAATSGFNSRVLETKLAAAIIAKSHSASEIPLDSTITLGKVKDQLFGGMTTQEITSLIRSDKVFKGSNEFSVDEVCERLEMSRSELVQRFNTSENFLKEVLKDKLQLLNRCEHVFEEAERVDRFRSICDTTTDIGLLGQLMTQSHYSLRDKYDCSHPALDRLVNVALDAGALGSRLTGAGWGGCVITLAEAAKSATVFERLKEVSMFTFQTEPQSGCQVFKLQDK